jgi:hypothetical protein
VNIQRFREVLQYIEAHPREWRQVSCMACFLFHAAKLNGEIGIQLHAEWGHDFLQIPLYGPMWSWLFDGCRTLDDFRTMARRTFS